LHALPLGKKLWLSDTVVLTFPNSHDAKCYKLLCELYLP
jgi:hypothetical protein